MNETKKNVWNKRIPSIIGILFLALSLGTIGWLSGNAVLFGTKAATDGTPKNITISNISDTAFTVFFITDEPTQGTITYGTTSQPNLVEMDDRDQKTATITKHSMHHITIHKLEKATKYFFTISSDSKTYLNKNAPYEVTTVTDSKSLPEEGTMMNGKIINDDGTTPLEAIAYASLNGKIASGLVDASGTYSFDLSVLGSLSSDTVLNLTIVDATKQSKVSLAGNQVNAVPLVTLSKNYDFLFGNEPLDEQNTASESAEGGSFSNSNGTENTNTSGNPQILSPTADQEYKDQQPLFRGTALPNEEVEITIQSDQEINTIVKAGSSGNWQFRPETKLAPGNHTITIKTIDASGALKTITQSFVVFAEGSQFTEPSVSPSTPVPSVTATPTTLPTTLPTATSTPLPTITSLSTVVPTEITISPTQTQSTIPVTGNATLMVAIIGIFSTVVIGTLLFFLTAV